MKLGIDIDKEFEKYFEILTTNFSKIKKDNVVSAKNLKHLIELSYKEGYEKGKETGKQIRKIIDFRLKKNET